MCTFKTLTEAWLADIAATRRQKTTENYAITARKLLAWRPELTERPLVRRDILAFRDWRATQVCARTANRDVRAIKACLNWGSLNEMGHPVVETRKLLLPEPPLKDWAMSSEEVQRVFKAAQFDMPITVVLRICSGTGFRIGEVINLRWADVDFERGMMRVSAKEDWSAKSARSYRSVHAPETVAWLSSYRQTLRKRGPEDYVCQRVPSRGIPWVGNKSTRIYGRVRKVFDAAGMTERYKTSHRFRHTLATDLVSSGAPIHDAQAILGHSSPAITLAIYTHATESGIIQAGNRLEEYRRNR